MFHKGSADIESGPVVGFEYTIEGLESKLELRA
jgi:hypothetical protein